MNITFLQLRWRANLNRVTFISIVCIAPLAVSARFEAAEPSLREVASFKAKEAHQGVAVDDQHFYAITNTEIGKYERGTSKRVAQWISTKDVALKHLNSGVVIEGRLYSAHSNWPLQPPKNSLEIWDTETLAHVATHSFDTTDGALNWVDRHDGHWYAVFAHYQHGDDTGSKLHVSRTRLVKFDGDWNILESWTFPEKVWQRFAPSSNSGGSFASDGTLYCTGHDHAEVYVMRLPEQGAVLEYVATLPAPIAGQGIAWHRSPQPTLFGIRRAKREVVQMELSP